MATVDTIYFKINMMDPLFKSGLVLKLGIPQIVLAISLPSYSSSLSTFIFLPSNIVYLS